MEPAQKMCFPGSWRVQLPDQHPGLVAASSVYSQGSGSRLCFLEYHGWLHRILSTPLTLLESPGSRDSVHCFVTYSAQLSPRLGSQGTPFNGSSKTIS